MNKPLFSLFFSMTLLLLPVTASAAASTTAPDVLARNVTDEVVQILRTDKDLQAGSQKKARDLIETRIAPHFNFTSMTKLALGKNWASATPEQRKALTAEFRALLVQTYTASITLFKDQKIEYRPLKVAPEDNDVLVRSLVKSSSGGEPVQVDYGMEKTDEGWKVYNVKIGGISLVENYRGTFNTEIQKSGVDGLIKTLREKNRALVAQTK
ncbi:MAG: phospholipid transporter substrate-binding protein [Pseudomonadota bacterium]|jgi:phospholipid transport system substrate-binding protein